MRVNSIQKALVEIDENLRAFTAARDTLSQLLALNKVEPPQGSESVPAQRHKMSASARRRISLAQKARWAATRKKAVR